MEPRTAAPASGGTNTAINFLLLLPVSVSVSVSHSLCLTLSVSVSPVRMFIQFNQVRSRLWIRMSRALQTPAWCDDESCYCSHILFLVWCCSRPEKRLIQLPLPAPSPCGCLCESRCLNDQTPTYCPKSLHFHHNNGTRRAECFSWS